MKQWQRLSLALGLGLASAGGVFAYVSGANQRAEAGEPMGPVLVAKEAITASTKLAPEAIAVEERPVRFIPAGSMARPDQAVGRVARIEIAKGEPLSEAKLFAPGQEQQAILPVPAGMRAITVAVDEVVGVAGFVQPGMIVDVVSTMDVDGKAVTKFLLQKVKVLACAQDAKHKEDSEAKVVSSATLAVSPQDAEKLILAADRGKIRLAMRDPHETQDAKTAGATPESMLGLTPPKPAQTVTKTRIVRVSVRPSERTPDIMIIRGTSTEIVQR